MALQFSYDDRHAYFNRNHGKNDAVVFMVLSVSWWLVNGELEGKWSGPNQYWHLLKRTEKTMENLGQDTDILFSEGVDSLLTLRLLD